jgi:hypothetical protein
MQDFGDSVAELETAAATPYALQRDIAEFRRQEVDTERGLVAKIARRRFLDSLKEAKAAEQDCLICGDAYTADKEGEPYHSNHIMVDLSLQKEACVRGSYLDEGVCSLLLVTALLLVIRMLHRQLYLSSPMSPL